MSQAAVAFVDLLVEGPEVEQVAEEEQAAGEEPDQAAQPLAQVEAVNAKDAEERQQDPGDGVVVRTGDVAAVGGAVHRRDQEQVDQPADSEQAEGEEPN